MQHAAGERVRQRLITAGVGVPEGWRIVQDHPRRGLIVTPSPDTSHHDVLAWTLEAGRSIDHGPTRPGSRTPRCTFLCERPLVNPTSPRTARR